MRIRTTSNIIRVLGDASVEKEVKLTVAPSGGLTPGCIVTPVASSASESFDGSTGAVAPPTSADELTRLGIINFSSGGGKDLSQVFERDEQVSIFYALRGEIYNVRTSGTATITKGQFLTAATNGSGLMQAGTADNAIGLALEDTPSGEDTALTFIKMEVL